MVDSFFTGKINNKISCCFYAGYTGYCMVVIIEIVMPIFYETKKCIN